MTKTHIWVKHVVTPVQVLTDDQGHPVVFVDPDQQDIAEENAAYGCNVCGEPLAGNTNTECGGLGDD